MYIQRILAINMAAFAALGTVLLALGEQNPVLAVVAVLAAMTAVWITDIFVIFRLNRRVTNVAVLLAVLRSLWELFQIQGAVQVMAIANLLAYVMIILLFQEKDFRTWWHIALLSLLQVAASATFFQEILFAPLLLIYFFVGLSAVALLFLHHERTHYHQVRHHPIVPRPIRTLTERLGINWRRLGKIVLATLVVGPVSLFLDYGEADNARLARRRARRKAHGTGRWPLIHEDAEFTGSADSLGGRAGIGLEFYGHLARMVPGTLVVAVALFLVIPRMGRFDLGPRQWGWGSAERGPSVVRATGFSDTVELGEVGNLSEDPEEVMRVRFLMSGSNRVYPMKGTVYLRGALLNHYEKGKWDFREPIQLLNPFASTEGRLRPEINRPPGLVRQLISIRPLDRREIFCIWPFVPVVYDRRLSIDYATSRLLRTSPHRSDPAPFSIGTCAVVDGQQVPLTPDFPLSSNVAANLDQLKQIPRRDLKDFVRIADQWTRESGLRGNQVVELARYLESKFTVSDRFRYSLEGQAREPGVDPVEDFVLNRPLGHCEYFASALALMLRSQGIPSRVVNGFVTSEYDVAGGYYRVRQRDAHSWVEAYVAPGQLPEARPFGRTDAQWQNGGWLRLDPTPAREADTGLNGIVGNVRSWFERMEDMWLQYVVQMNGATQREAIYDPLRAMLQQLTRQLADADGWTGLWQVAAGLPARLARLLGDAGWFSWVGASLLLGALGFGYAVYRLVRASVRLLVRLLPRGRARAGRRSPVAFYRRLEALLARRGLRRRPGQTHREFAHDAGLRLADGQGGLAQSAALLVTEAFYDVRFGGGRLDSVRMERVEQALHDLERVARGQYQGGTAGEP
ncbi:MAG: transglutaminase TgpA family protein [Thermoguttaceae bacterium]